MTEGGEVNEKAKLFFIFLWVENILKKLCRSRLQAMKKKERALNMKYSVLLLAKCYSERWNNGRKKVYVAAAYLSVSIQVSFMLELRKYLLAREKKASRGDVLQDEAKTFHKMSWKYFKWSG